MTYKESLVIEELDGVHGNSVDFEITSFAIVAEQCLVLNAIFCLINNCASGAKKSTVVTSTVQAATWSTSGLACTVSWPRVTKKFTLAGILLCFNPWHHPFNQIPHGHKIARVAAR